MADSLKIWFWGDAGVSTGFGRMTHHFAEGLLARGHDVHVYAVNWKGDHKQIGALKGRAEVARVFTNPNDVYGVAGSFESVTRFGPDVAVIFNDLPVIMQILPTIPPVPTVLYFPVDCADIPGWWLQPLRLATAGYTFTRHGVDEVAKVDPRMPVGVIPHAIDADLFYPISPARPGVVRTNGGVYTVYSRDECRAMHGVSDKFVILWADRNSQRKNPQGFLSAIAPFLRSHPDAILWMHCSVTDEGGDLTTWFNKYGLGRQVRMSPNQDTFYGVSNADLNGIYNIADIRVSSSLGEGFGLITGEAAAAGVPQVLPEFTCFREVAGPGAVYIPSQAPYYTQLGSRLMYPDLFEMTAAVEVMYHKSAAERRDIGMLGRQHVVANFAPEDTIDLFERALVDAARYPVQPLLSPIAIGA